jgi:hypothetical protein
VTSDQPGAIAGPTDATIRPAPTLRRRIKRLPVVRPVWRRVHRFRLQWPDRKLAARAWIGSSPVWYGMARRRDKEILLCLGDSHCDAFIAIRHRKLLAKTWLNVLPVGGATARGMSNPDSMTRALPTFERFIARIPPGAPVLFCLGEVDCGYLLWSLAERDGTDVKDEATRSLDALFAFLDDLRGRSSRTILLTTVPLPTIVDLARWKGLDGARGSVKADIAARTELTRWFSQQLRTRAAEHDCRLVDYEEDILDPRTGLVAARFVNPDPHNHHLDYGPLSPILADKLRAAGFG